MKNIYVQNTSSGNISHGVLGVETDVLYQWRDLVPTVERRLTPINGIFINNIRAGNIQFISRINGQKELPVKNVTLNNVKADTIKMEKYIHENVIGFRTN